MPPTKPATHDEHWDESQNLGGALLPQWRPRFLQSPAAASRQGLTPRMMRRRLLISAGVLLQQELDALHRGAYALRELSDTS